MKHEMKLQHSPFDSIKSGDKTIEMRLYDEKRQKLKVYDTIEFTDLLTSEKMLVKILKMHRYKNFDELYSHFDKSKLGYKKNETAHPNDMSQYYSDEEIKKYGVVGIEIERL